MRLLIALPLLAATPATAPTGFTPGLWQVESAPGKATLNGRSLGNLPYDAPAAPGTICLTATDANSGAWLARDIAPGCTLTRRKLGKGRIDFAGTCAPQAPGLARGAVRLSGRWTRTSYDLRFTTRNPSENGVMGFTGTMTGKRIGDCPD